MNDSLQWPHSSKREPGRHQGFNAGANITEELMYASDR